MPVLSPRTIAALTLLAAILASSLAGHGSRASATAAHADAFRASAAHAHVRSPDTAPGSTGVWLGGSRTCPLAVVPAGYVNPLAGAVVKPERIDQGVDYAGSGTLVAIGAARVTYVATSGTGWPGAFIEYRLLGGADGGCYVFYAEGVVPAAGLHVGETVGAGDAIATIIPHYPSGIEIGWGAGKSTKAYAEARGQWSPTDDQDNVATAAGKDFSALIAALGGPPGKVEG